MNFPVVFMLFFSCDCKSLQQWSFSQLSKDNIPQHDRADFPKAQHPFSFPQAKPLPSVISQLTDRAASHLENLRLPLRTTWGLLPISMFASKCYPLASQASTHQGLPLPFNLLFQRRLPRQKPAYQHCCSPAGLLSHRQCELLEAPWGEGMALPSRAGCLPPDSTNNCWCY